ncbi:MW1434 family type I TA system toxin [Streptomyces sp. NPDC049879]|uniref:Thoeris anti-defense Tad2 family protein n=1 Tax=Streptomyces sp. NPDC049879 TaxID=3365598 RepID=UPI003788B8A0
MDFSAALVELKAGKRCARRGWIADGKWVALRTGYPDGIAVNGNTAESFGVPEGTVVRFQPYFQMCEKDGTVRTWNKGDQDLIATDWYVVDGIGTLETAVRGYDEDRPPLLAAGTAGTVATVTLEFEATHDNVMLPKGHHERGIHGHQYVVVFEFTGQDAARIDQYEEMLQVWKDRSLRGRFLNDVLGERPTAEQFAIWAYGLWCNEIHGLAAVHVSESRNLTATYRGASGSADVRS